MENSDLKPCWACGKNVTIGEGGHPVFPFRIACCARVEGRTKEDVTKIWNGNYGWKLLAEKSLACDAYEASLSDKNAKIKELESEMASIRQLKHVAQEAMTEQAETVKVLTEALERNLGAAIKSTFYAESALDRVRGK